MEKNFIDEFIPSKDTRDYLHSIHHEFTDLEKATIVANHIMISYEKKVKWLNSFKEKISDDTLKDRISKALVQIKKDKKYYRKCNTALGALPYNESLFDFVFIPHDFRNGDIVRSLYGGWNTIEFCEKVGIILSYFDKDYEFYKNLRGDYSDAQVCVDIKFDGVAYQGEFEHEHINPIYIERMTLNEKDERLALSLIAPLGVNIGNLISNGLLLFSEKTGFIGLGVLAALWEFLVMTGMHLALMMPMLASFFETGQMSGAALCGTFATWAVFGVALGATLRLKGKKEKGASFGFLVSGIVGGITEPTLYGLCFNHKRCFGTMILGAFVGGVYASITSVTVYIMTNANFLSLLGFVCGSKMNIINGVVSCILSMLVAAVFTYLFGFSKEELTESK